MGLRSPVEVSRVSAASGHTDACTILSCIAEHGSGWAPGFCFQELGAWPRAWLQRRYQKETVEGGLGLTKKRVIRSSMVGLHGLGDSMDEAARP